jgi:hypothetical protein
MKDHNHRSSRERRRISFTKIHAAHPVIAMKSIRTRSEFIMTHNTPRTEGAKNIFEMSWGILLYS